MENLIDIHTHKHNLNAGFTSIYNVVLGRDEIPAGLYSCGIHPWFIDPNSNSQLQHLEKIAQDKNCMAVGECGIDKLRGPAINLQTEVFEKQISLAQKLSKPLIIHCVKAFEEVYQSLKKQNYTGYFILHGFNSKSENALKLSTLNGCLFSFGTALLKTGSNAEKLFAALELEKCFFETDDKEAEIKNIYLRAAEIKGISVEELILQIKTNYDKIFH